jgi:hypothetical protein
MNKTLSQFKYLDEEGNLENLPQAESKGSTQSGSNQKFSANKERRGKRFNIELLNIDDLSISNELSLPIVQAKILAARKGEAEKSTRVLLDTGASKGNYISTELYEVLVQEENVNTFPCNTQICSLINSSCVQCKTKIEINLKFLNEINDDYEVISFLACPLNSLNGVDIIIGYQDIVKNNLIEKMGSIFGKGDRINHDEKSTNQTQVDDGLSERRIMNTIFEKNR